MKPYRISRVTDPADSLALVTLEQAKLALGVTDASQDAAIQQQIDQVSAAIHSHCDRIFPRQGYRDQFRYLWCPPKPIRARQYPIPVDIDGVPLLAVTVDGVLVDPSSFEVDIESGEVYRLAELGPWAWSGSTVVLDYDGGYDVIPPDLQGSTLEWLTVRWTTKGRDPTLRSETIPDVISQTWAVSADSSGSSAMPSLVRDWLNPYLRLSV